MASLFISYSHAESELAHTLSADLEKVGHKAWIDFAGIRGGQHWISEIDLAIRACDFFLLLFSENSLRSDWVERETILALNINKPVILLICDDTRIPVHLVICPHLNIQDYERAFSELSALVLIPRSHELVQHFRRNTSEVLYDLSGRPATHIRMKTVIAVISGSSCAVFLMYGMLDGFEIAEHSPWYEAFASIAFLLGGILGYIYLQDRKWALLIIFPILFLCIAQFIAALIISLKAII